MSGRDPRAVNRAGWNRLSDDYQERHGHSLSEEPMAWGVWRIPEAELRVLGDTAGKEVLELGCGAAQWSVALAGAGARVVGVDLSESQLAHARRHSAEAAVGVPLVQAPAESLPFRDAAFDIVFCDHGAMTFAVPQPAVAEVSRVLKAGGSFVFCMSTPIRDLCTPADGADVGDRLLGDYFELGPTEEDGTVCFQLSYGDWIRLFRRHGLIVEDLVELRAPAGASTSYDDYVPHEWARGWPAEHIWRVRKSG